MWTEGKKYEVKLLPVVPLLCAADEVDWHFLDVFQSSITVRVKEGQSGLNERAGSLVQATFIVVCWVTAVELRLGQDQVHQADELLRAQPEYKFLCFLLHKRKRKHQLSASILLFRTLFSLEKIKLDDVKNKSRVWIILGGSSGHVLARYEECGCTPTGSPALTMDRVW